MKRRSLTSPATRRSLSDAVVFACESLETRRMLAFAVPPMNSLPGAVQSLYLDFDGDPATLWVNSDGVNYVHGPAGDDPVPAFDWDGDPTTLDGGRATGPERSA